MKLKKSLGKLRYKSPKSVQLSVRFPNEVWQMIKLAVRMKKASAKKDKTQTGKKSVVIRNSILVECIRRGLLIKD